MAIFQDENYNDKKISGHFASWNPTTGGRIEGETRSCCHCGHMWIPKKQLMPLGNDPKVAMIFNKATIEGERRQVRGYCTDCQGHVCGRPVCIKAGCVPMKKKIEMIEKISNQHGRRELPLIGA